MSIPLKTLTIDLTKKIDEKDIQELINEVTRLQAALQIAMDGTMAEMVTWGEKAAKHNLTAAFPGVPDDDGTIGWIATGIQSQYSYDSREGHVFSNDPEAVYYEYGTGYVAQNGPHEGIQQGESTPPVMTYGSRTYTKYDTYDHGFEGWTYKQNGKVIKTNGLPPFEFMYRTYRSMEMSAPDVFANKLRRILK